MFVLDVDTHFRKAKSAGAKIVEDLNETCYGERQYEAEDLGGHHWLFSQHARDLSPDEWGAKVSETKSRPSLLPRHRLCDLEVPATDVRQSAAFHEKVFGWNIWHRGSAHPSFDDATGDVSGSFATGRQISPEPDLLPYIWVESIDAALNRAAVDGGVVAEGPHPDSPGSACWIATFRDPAGNLMGLYQESPR